MKWMWIGVECVSEWQGLVARAGLHLRKRKTSCRHLFPRQTNVVAIRSCTCSWCLQVTCEATGGWAGGRASLVVVPVICCVGEFVRRTWVGGWGFGSSRFVVWLPWRIGRKGKRIVDDSCRIKLTYRIIVVIGVLLSSSWVGGAVEKLPCPPLSKVVVL